MLGGGAVIGGGNGFDVCGFEGWMGGDLGGEESERTGLSR